MNRKILIYVSWATIVLACTVILWVIWSLLWPFNPLQVSSKDNFTVANPGKTVGRGEKLMVNVSYCYTDELPVQKDSTIEQEDRVMLLATQYPELSKGCVKKQIPLITIPRNMALESTTAAGDGKAIVRVTYRFRVNALRDVTYTFVTDEFTIDP